MDCGGLFYVTTFPPWLLQENLYYLRMDAKSKALTRVHIGYICMGLTAALVKTISWDPLAMIWTRSVIGVIFLTGVLLYQKNTWNISRKHLVPLGITGVLMAVHWMTFFYSIVIAGVPTAVVSVASIPMFSAILEPLLHKRRPENIDLFLGLLVLLGAAFIVEDFSIQSSSGMGVGLGILSAICKSLRDTGSKSLVQQYGSAQILMYQLCVTALLLLPWYHPMSLEWSSANIWSILIMGVVGTGIAHALVTSGFHSLKVFTVNILGSVAPLYQILFGILLVKDIPTMRICIGGSVIIGISALETWRQGKRQS